MILRVWVEDDHNSLSYIVRLFIAEVKLLPYFTKTESIRFCRPCYIRHTYLDDRHLV